MDTSSEKLVYIGVNLSKLKKFEKWDGVDR